MSSSSSFHPFTPPTHARAPQLPAAGHFFTPRPRAATGYEPNLTEAAGTAENLGQNNSRVAMSLETKPLLGEGSSVPSGIPPPHAVAHACVHLKGPIRSAKANTQGCTATFASSLSQSSARRLPQAIAHRGFKSLYPENTLLAFRGALDAGAHALETDLHLSRDGVVVLSHDGNLKRCFGIDKKINECDWAYLKTLRTLMAPGECMPRLEDLLVLLAEKGAGRDRVWMLLDIKTDDPPAELLSHVAKVLESTPGPVPWEKRIVFGCWNANKTPKQPYITHVRTILPAYALALISWSPLYARKFLSASQPNLSFNMFQKALVGPVGQRFIKDVQEADRRLFAWTVNDEEWMEWSIRAGVDGVITDDPELFLEVCRRWKDDDDDDETTVVPKATGEEPAARAARRAGRVRDGTWRRTLRLHLNVAAVQALILLFTPVLMIVARFGFVGPGPKTTKALRL
ncbi:putative glycerophosphoryl diester phosphodiesterase [Colletotrichum sublineola]|uniref:Putative glycerophosphoryl diester phosphodiesterase n=1 Tax=Colletotrichum sublineola TaxID=1173701 RepID=A0A066XHH6_COLSU|nr:putative glycerophosphoryl diester phosphodiesterase [Colletotrichum sublineola]